MDYEKGLSYMRRCIAYEYMKGREPDRLIDEYVKIAVSDNGIQKQSDLEKILKEKKVLKHEKF